MIYVVYRPVLGNASDDAAQTEAFLDWEPKGVGWPIRWITSEESPVRLGERVTHLADSEGAVLVLWDWAALGSVGGCASLIEPMCNAKRKKVPVPMWVELLTGGCFDLTGGYQQLNAHMHSLFKLAKPEDFSSPYHPR